MKRLLVTAVVISAALASGSALAADLYAPVKAIPAPLPYYNWTGCYIGINGGGATVRDKYASTWSEGGLFGGQVGCNYQIDHLVVGIEGEGDWSGASSTQDTSAGFFPGTPVTAVTFKNGWDADVAVRFGLAFDRFFIYQKIGVAWADHQFSTTVSGLGGTLITGSATLPGVLVGLGLEYGFMPQWTAKVEVDAMYYAATDVTLTCSPVVVCGGSTGVLSENSVGITAKLGLNYKFW
jgi:outer membrane immunogenic protein